MTAALDRLVDTLLYEGYALYPYTPEATKNATPTPFGIVYPPAYAAGQTSTFDHVRMEGVVDGGPDATIAAEVRFLAPCGPRHQARAERLALAPVPLTRLLAGPVEHDSVVVAEDDAPLRVTLQLDAVPAPDGRARVRFTVASGTVAPADTGRAEALGRSLLSTHPILRVRGGRFASPLDVGDVCDSANTWPVLATMDDDVLLGAAIVLPDHPQLAPESRGDLFDGTEMEEALLLHVQALSDDERAAIERQDPAVREMVARAAAATPEDLARLHGRVTIRDPLSTAPPVPSAAVRDPTRGEEHVETGGKAFRRGGTVLLRPSADADLHARMCAGRTATVERIFIELDGRVHLGVTVDDVPGQDLLRETGRLLFFFADEVEVIAP